MNLQSELCLWTLLGLLRTIFDATLFKVNANLKQVWQMNMPPELSMPVQRVLRTMISGVMLVQCFTVYVYLASYIVLLYPVFLEERPTLVLPWLLLAAIRKFLCELTSLALGLGTCLLLGPARPPCIKFVVTKVATIMPAFYMWMLVFSYYNTLKVASAFKTFPAALQSSDHDYGLELAVRRRRTKSLQDENQLRKKLVASLNYGDRHTSFTGETSTPRVLSVVVCSNGPSQHTDSTKTEDILRPFSTTSERMTDLGAYEDWGGNDVVPRDTDRILEQFVFMLLRISAYLGSTGSDSMKLFHSTSRVRLPYNLDCTALSGEDTDTPPQVGNKGRTASYLQEYPQIFMKDAQRPTEFVTPKTVNNQNENDDNEIETKSHRPKASMTTSETKSLEVDKARKKNTRDSSKNIDTGLTTHKQPSETSTIASTYSRKPIDLKFTPMLETKHEEIKSVSENNYAEYSELLKPEAISFTGSKHTKEKQKENEKENNNTISSPKDSIDSIINRMRNTLSHSKGSCNKDKIKPETNVPTTSRANNITDRKRLSGAHDAKDNSHRLTNTSKRPTKSEKNLSQNNRKTERNDRRDSNSTK